MGRYGSNEYDGEERPYRAPDKSRSRERVRIRASTDDASERTPQRKEQGKYRDRGKEVSVMSDAPEGESIKRQIKRLLLDDDNLSARDIAEMLGRDAPSIVTISNIRSEFRDSVRFLRQLGWSDR